MAGDVPLSERVCLVTGGASGIGWALVKALAREGASVHACDVSEENLARVEEEARREGLSVHLARCDVADRVATERWVSDVVAREGRVDVLVNNAAFIRWESVEAMPVEDVERTMRVGYDGMVYATRAVLPHMRAAGRGHIVNLGSLVGRVFVRGPSAAYAAVKAAIDAYTQMLQIELEGSPLRVTLVRLAAVAGTQFFGRHVDSARMPRIADLVPPLAPEVVARALVRALRRGERNVDLPRFLPAVYLLFALAPGLTRWFATVGGAGRRDYSLPRGGVRTGDPS